MPEANNEAQRFYQNLIDIGLGDEVISRCLYLKNENRIKELMITLQSSRRDLLHHIHEDQKKLDCLDYLVCWLNKKDGK